MLKRVGRSLQRVAILTCPKCGSHHLWLHDHLKTKKKKSTAQTFKCADCSHTTVNPWIQWVAVGRGV